MKWFKHDTDSSRNKKIHKLLMRHGAQGYAVYFYCLECIAGSLDQDNLTFELEHDAEIIADALKIKAENIGQSPVDVVNHIIKTIVDLDLFQMDNTGRVYCYKLKERVDKSMTSNPKMREMLGKLKSHDPVMIQSAKVMQEENRLDKKRKDNILNQSINNIFDYWMNCKSTPKHKDIKPHIKVIEKSLNDYDYEEIKNAIKNYDEVISDFNTYFFNYKWTISNFLKRGLFQFIDEVEPLNNFRRDKNNKPLTEPTRRPARVPETGNLDPEIMKQLNAS